MIFIWTRKLIFLEISQNRNRNTSAAGMAAASERRSREVGAWLAWAARRLRRSRSWPKDSATISGEGCFSGRQQISAAETRARA